MEIVVNISSVSLVLLGIALLMVGFGSEVRIILPVVAFPIRASET
jgi:hypothetical protein